MHQGSRRHPIPKVGRVKMTFFWPRARFQGRGRRLPSNPRVTRERVMHPGNKRPNRFLTIPLHQFGRAANFRVRTVGASRGFLP